mmetsp:Transcript_3384/g.2832  ORF Transcript_3384/g.2832 Transcript_3384/m.2832 type:complete len:118 (+) Transcript_3384:23-376(+)
MEKADLKYVKQFNSFEDSTSPTSMREEVSYESLINTLGYELVNLHHAKWIYCNEGNNNITAIFKITTDPNELADKYLPVLQHLDNTVFRVKKTVKSKYKVPGIIDDEMKYSKYFYNF